MDVTIIIIIFFILVLLVGLPIIYLAIFIKRIYYRFTALENSLKEILKKMKTTETGN